MKNKSSLILLILLGVILLVAAFLYGAFFMEKEVTLPNNPQQNTTSTAQPSNTVSVGSVKITYPSILSLTQQGETVTLRHAIDHTHPNPCDFKGDGSPLAQLTDFNVSLTMATSGLRDAMKRNESSALVEDNFKGDTPTLSEGFIDAYEVGFMKGYRVTSGVEGCGRFTYYFPIAVGQTLFVHRAFISEFQPINGNRDTYLALPGIIPPAEEERLFKDILSSIQL